MSLDPRPSKVTAKGDRPLRVFQFLLIVGAAWWIFSPVFRGEWLWDDNLDLFKYRWAREPAGLWKIWFAPAGADYFPMKATANWIQCRLWGTDPLGYHLTNVVLHVLSALLFWRLLAKLGLKGAWWGGLLLIAHPLVVESVAWVSELKNTLSLPLLLLAMIAYLDFDARLLSLNPNSAATVSAARPRSRRPGAGLRSYLGALGCFLAAMLSKTSVVMFPFVLLLHAWWRRGRISRRDLLASAPFFAVSLILGGVTVWFQSHGTDVRGVVPSDGFPLRLLEAGLALGFYFMKCVWPVNLMPIYPGWVLGPHKVWPLLVWSLLAGCFAWLWIRRQTWGRPVLLGLGFFAVNLAPVLGLVPMSFQRFAPVSDHFAYLPLPGVIGLAVAAGGSLFEGISAGYRLPALAGALAICGLLAGQSRAYARIFRDSQSLWSYAIRHDPGSWVAHVNLGVALTSAGRLPEAVAQIEQALRLNPGDSNAHFVLANALRDLGRRSEAIAQYREALRIRPADPETHNNLASVLAEAGRLPEAVSHFEAAVQLDPANAEVRNNFGNTLRQAGRGGEAIAQYEQALRLNPDLPAADFNLAVSLSEAGRWPEAIPPLERTVQLQPDFPDAEDDLGIALANTGRLAEAVPHFLRAVQLKPDSAATQRDLATALNAVGRTEEAQAHWAEAARLESATPPRPE